MKKRITPEKRVGNTANLMIFLGILYSSLSILAFTGCDFFNGRGYGVVTLIIAISVIGLGYAIRFGSQTCLYVATGIFTAAAVYFIFVFLSGKSFFTLIRLSLCLLVLSSLGRSIPAMIKLKATGSDPDRSSKYKNFFLRRK